MKARQWHEENGGNLSWCRPYIDKRGKNAVALNEGEPVGIMLDGKEIEADKKPGDVDAPLYSEAMLERVARAMNPDYDIYSGWDSTHIILNSGLNEGDCRDCPWFAECDAMDEGEDEDEEEDSDAE